MTMSIQHTHFVFREARTASELESLFQLRYQGYLKSSCASLVHQNEYGLEFDSYDWHAFHLGLFQEGQYGAQPVGYMRLVQDKPSPMASLVSKLAGQFPELPPPPAADAPLPMIGSCPQKDWLLGWYRSRTQLGQRVVEGSRFVFSPEIRASGYARFVFEGALASTFYRYGYDYALLACHPRHSSFYLQYGFQQLLDGNSNNYKGLSASILGMTKGEIARKRAAGIEAMARQGKSDGSIYMLPDNSTVAVPMPKVSVSDSRLALNKGGSRNGLGQSETFGHQ